MRHVFPNRRLQRALAEEYQMIQTLLTDSPYPPFQISIGMNRQLHPILPVVPERSGSRIRFILCLGRSTDWSPTVKTGVRTESIFTMKLGS